MTKPPGAKSARVNERPNVLSPGIWFTKAKVGTAPNGLFGTAALARPSKKKSAAVMFAASLHANPLTFVPVVQHYYISHDYLCFN